jgi:hypothetical protein
MKTIAIVLISGFIFSSSDYDKPLTTKGIMRVDKIYDDAHNVVCYMAQNKDGSTHTTPSIFCLKTK